MWTRNYQNLINTMAFVSNGNASSTIVSRTNLDDSVVFSFKDVAGDILDFTLFTSNKRVTQCSFIQGYFSSDNKDKPNGNNVDVANSVKTNADTIFLYFGNGAGVESFEDYKLTDIDGISAVGSMTNTISKNSDGKYVSTITGIIKATNACTISEFGLFRMCGVRSNYNSTNDFRRVLLYRKVLDTPITLAAGGTASVSFSITLPIITILQN